MSEALSESAGVGLRMAASTVDITPSAPAPLAGYARRTGPFVSIADALEANVVAFRSDEGVVAIVSVDALYVGALRSMVCERLKQPIEPAHLFMAASHSHFAPATDPLLPALGTVDMGYLAQAAQSIANAIDAALTLQRGTDVTVNAGTAPTDSTINRRRKTLSLKWRPLPHLSYGVQIAAPHSTGERDGVIRVIVLRSALSSEVVAVLWSLACHPVAFPQRESVSAEFPGVVRALLRQRFGAGVPVVFLQGFAGNVRPRLGMRMRRIGPFPLGTRFVTPSDLEWNDWATTLGREVVAACVTANQRVDANVSTRRIELPLRSFVNTADAARTVSLHRVSFGRELCLLGVSAEPVAEYAAQLSRALQASRVVPVGYIDSVYGYLPTTAVMREGGYEAGGFFPAFGLSGELRSDLEPTFLSAVARLA